MTVKIAFCSIDLKGSYKETMEHYDAIEAVISSFIMKGKEMHLLSFDMVHAGFRKSNEMRALLGASLGIDSSNIILHFTHTHTGPRDEDMIFDILIPKLYKAIEKNKQEAVEAKMAYSEVDTQGKWNVNRRKLLPHGLGKMTVWAGFEENEGRLDGQRIVQRRLMDWFGEDCKEADLGPQYYDEDERDTLLQGMFFTSMGDKSLGGIIRFACHPPVAGHTKLKRYSADFPGYLRRILNDKCGGEFMYLTGPCGNITPWELGDWEDIPNSGNIATMPPLGPQKELDAPFEEAHRIAMGLFNDLETVMPKEEDYEVLEDFDISLSNYDLKLRDDLVPDLVKANEEKAALLVEMANNKKLTMGDYKKKVDHVNFLDYQKYFEERSYLDGDDHANGYVTINIPSIRLNQLVLQGMPGESFFESAEEAEKSVKEQGKNFISFSFANGSIAYLPSDEERPFGDYETAYCVAAKGAVSDMSEFIKNCSLKMI